MGSKTKDDLLNLHSSGHTHLDMRIPGLVGIPGKDVELEPVTATAEFCLHHNQWGSALIKKNILTGFIIFFFLTTINIFFYIFRTTYFAYKKLMRDTSSTSYFSSQENFKEL